MGWSVWSQLPPEGMARKNVPNAKIVAPQMLPPACPQEFASGLLAQQLNNGHNVLCCHLTSANLVFSQNGSVRSSGDFTLVPCGR